MDRSKPLEEKTTESIRISMKVKQKLDSLKLHPRESYNDVIQRLIEFFEKNRGKE